MSLEALTNRGEYLSPHYLATVFPKILKQGDGLLAQWRTAAQAKQPTPRSGLASLRREYLEAKTALSTTTDRTRRISVLRDLHQQILTALGYEPKPGDQKVVTSACEFRVVAAHADHRVIAIESEWADSIDSAADADGAGRLLFPVDISPRDQVTAATKLVGHLFAADDPPPYVLILGGAVLTLADRRSWAEGRYLAVNFDVAFARNDARQAGELDVLAALFGRPALHPLESGDDLLTTFLQASRQHAVGVDKDLRDGLKQSVELIANEVLDRLREAGVRPEQLMDPKECGRALTTQSLRYLYRILFLLFAEARPELDVLSVNRPEYVNGYSMARLGDLVTRKLVGDAARSGFHLYESLDLLFRLVNTGHRPRGHAPIDEKASESEGLRFEPLRSDLFLPEAITLIGRDLVHPDDDPADPDARRLDTRLRNRTLRDVLRLLMLKRGKRGERGGFISYAQLDVEQLGAVYERLMSYTGFIAGEELYEVAKGGEPKDGSWVVPASAAADYDDAVFVRELDDHGRRTGPRVRHPVGSFVYRLAGRDRQVSASYYTPKSLTQVTVELALKYRLVEAGPDIKAEDLLHWTICEPALGSGAFLNEAIDQVAAEYLRRRQHEVRENLDPEGYLLEKQRVKTYIALHNCYGVDLNRTAVELAEVSLWLNVMHRGLRAPWFGLHLRRGNSLIGGSRRYYPTENLRKGEWLTSAPVELPFRAGELPEGAIHHFLLPATGWCAVAGEKEAKTLAPEATKVMGAWRKTIRRVPANNGKSSQVKRLQGLAQRVEYLWGLVRQRLDLSEQAIRRDIPVWKADDLPRADGARPREQILADLEALGTPYWRLKTLMDTWCALWFWPLDAVDILTGTADAYQQRGQMVVEHTVQPVYEDEPAETTEALFDLSSLGRAEQLTLPSQAGRRRQIGTKPRTSVHRLDRRVPLADLDDWLAFAEALVGRTDVSGLFTAVFDDLDDLTEHEDRLVDAMAMDHAHRLPDRFPWLGTAVQIAEEQGFFHWELTFAHVFGKGGFDLQIGNPPWVRPDWDEDPVLAEFDPWFKLVEKPTPEQYQIRRQTTLAYSKNCHTYLSEVARNSGIAEFIGSPSMHPYLTGTRPDLYRAFMCRTWSNNGPHGTIGLIHPDTHFSGVREGRIRTEAYKRLRVHGTFVNVSNWAFPDLSRRQEFGVHVYGVLQQANFFHLSQLHRASVLTESMTHNGEGELPGQKLNGQWDIRPHRSRLIKVDDDTLTLWSALFDEEQDTLETPILNPITSGENSAIEALASPRLRLKDFKPQISSGFNEKNSKDDGTIIWKTLTPPTPSLDHTVLQGPHFSIATPFAKEPLDNARSNNDWTVVDLVNLPVDFTPRTNYRRACTIQEFRQRQDRWVDHGRLQDLLSSTSARHFAREELQKSGAAQPSEVDIENYLRVVAMRPYTEFFRLAWRSMIDPKGSERSLYPSIIPPGPSHVHAVHSLSLSSNMETTLNAGFWSSLPLDYLLRITGRSHLQVSEANKMPAPEPNHPLAPALLLRTLRLNCLTAAYSSLWSELFDPAWLTDHSWAVDWPDLPELGDIGQAWEHATPLRTERARRAALVEIDALVAVWLGLGIEELIATYRSRYPILADREANMYFDAAGRRIAADSYAFGYGQTKEHWQQFQSHREDGIATPAPDGFSAPFHKAMREDEMRCAHAFFTEQLRRATKGPVR